MPEIKDPPKFSFFEVLKNPKRFTQTRTEILMDATMLHGDVVRLPHPWYKLYVVTHPEGIKRVLLDNADNFRKSDEYQTLQEWVGEGLITSEGAPWARDRRIIQPTFTKDRLDYIRPFIEEIADSYVAKWQEGVVNISHDMTSLSLTVIGRFLFDCDISQHASEIGRIMDYCQAHITKRILTIDVAAWVTTPAQMEFLANLRRLKEIISFYSKCAGPGSMVDSLKKWRSPEGVGLSQSSITDHVIGMLVAGHETTAIALSWTLYLAAKHQDLQEKTRQEGEAAVLRLIQESMRLYPPIPCYGRQAKEEDVIMGLRIPKNGKVVVAPHVTHLRPDLWENPKEFNPDRFLPENLHKIKEHSYLPFGLGPRFCLGHKLAMMEIQICIQKFLENFEFSLIDTKPPKALALVSLRPESPILLKLKARLPKHNPTSISKQEFFSTT